jgi:hypothetical protein
LFVVHAEGSPFAASCGRSVWAQDIYTIQGLPAGPALPFVAELRVHGAISGSAALLAKLRDSATEESNYTTAAGPISYTLALAQSRPPGQPFQLEVLFDAYGNFPGGDATATAELVFSGLPTGAYVTSCQNYDVAVPAAQRTWGGLKAAYR